MLKIGDLFEGKRGRVLVKQVDAAAGTQNQEMESSGVFVERLLTLLSEEGGVETAFSGEIGGGEEGGEFGERGLVLRDPAHPGLGAGIGPKRWRVWHTEGGSPGGVLTHGLRPFPSKEGLQLVVRFARLTQLKGDERKEEEGEAGHGRGSAEPWRLLLAV